MLFTLFFFEKSLLECEINSYVNLLLEVVEYDKIQKNLPTKFSAFTGDSINKKFINNDLQGGPLYLKPPENYLNRLSSQRVPSTNDRVLKF